MRRIICALLVSVCAVAAQSFPSPMTTHPTVTYRVEPEYTREALDAGITGTVVLRTVISVEGRATEIEIVRGLGSGLDEKAVECLEKWRFKPATRNGEAVSTKANVEINFRLPRQQ